MAIKSGKGMKSILSDRDSEMNGNNRRGKDDDNFFSLVESSVTRLAKFAI
jgi:hypothetical protein